MAAPCTHGPAPECAICRAGDAVVTGLVNEVARLEGRIDTLVDLVRWLDRRCGLGLDARARVAVVLEGER